MTEIEQLEREVRKHLTDDVIPFWKMLRDNVYGGYYGLMDYQLKVYIKEIKGCILNSRITCFFSNAYTLLKDESLLNEARHGFEFLRDYCFDKKNGGIYWSVTYDGKPYETLKHTYNQAFAIYALSSYYEASADIQALDMAYELYDVIESKMRDEYGYKEAFDAEFNETANEKLSENGVMAQRTMNTLLHVFEAYTELYRVDHQKDVKNRIMWILDLIADKVYNPILQRQEVFFDDKWNSIIDLHSYGHDIETAWLIDRGLEIINEDSYRKKMSPITGALTQQVWKVAFDGHSLANECEKGVVNQWRVWWVQAEAVVGFINAYEKTQEKRYQDAAIAVWNFIKEYLIDRREGYPAGREWLWRVTQNGESDCDKPIAEPWKCPYHNGRMCFEIIKRLNNCHNL